MGLWQEAIQSNLAADAANKAYTIGTNPAAAANPATIATRYHALDFLTNAYLQLGRDRSAKAILDERNSFATFAVHLDYREHGVRGDSRSLRSRARCLGGSGVVAADAAVRVRSGGGDRVVLRARSERRVRAIRSRRVAVSSSCRRLRQTVAAAADTYWAEQIVIQEEAAAAWIAFADRDEPNALALMRSAADREDRSEKHVAMENRLSPMRELLGELLLQANRPREALREFESSLQTIPNRFRSLAGAAEAAAQLGSRRRATAYYRDLLALAANAESERPALTAARAFVGEQRAQ